MQKKKKRIQTDFTPFTRVNSKWIIDLNTKCGTLKFLEDNVGENLGDLSFGDEFLHITPKA